MGDSEHLLKLLAKAETMIRELKTNGIFYNSSIEADHPRVDFVEYEERLNRLLYEIETETHKPTIRQWNFSY